MIYSPWIVSESVPDFYSLRHTLSSPRFKNKTGEDLAIAIWELIVDHDLGLFHYLPFQDPFIDKDGHDPLLTINSFGFTICHVHAHIMAMLCKEAGFEVRIANIAGHEGTEVYYDDRWHYFDADIQMYYRLHEPKQDVIACLEEIHADPSLITDQKNPSKPFHFPDRLPEDMAKLYKVAPSYLPVLEERLHSMAFRLRPGESLQRYFHARGYWHLSPSYVRGFQKHATVKDGIGPGEAGPEGPTERFWPNRRYGNGFWYYKPDLTSKTRDIELGSDRFEGFAQDEKGLFLNRDNAVIECSFASPYLYCGIPDPHGRLPALNGAILNMSFNCGPNTELKVSIVDAAGKETMIVERTDEIDAEIDIDYTEWIDGSCHFKLIIAVKGDYFSLNHFANTLWCMVSPHALPALSQKGENKMAVHFGDCRSFKSRPLYENIRIDRHPEEIAQIVTCENVDYVPDTHSIIRSADKKNPWTLVFKIDTPKPLLWSSVYTLIEGYKPNEKIANRNFDFSCSDSPDGPWTEFKSGEILEHDQGWPAGFYGEAEFSGNSTTGYIRIRAFTGIPYLRFTHHFDDQPEYDSTLDVTHGWYGDDPEVGRRLRTHSQTIDSNTDAYTISCDETPHNAFIRLDCPSSNTDRNKKN